MAGAGSTSGQLIHASAAWEPGNLRWGHCLAGTFTPVPGGSALLDLLAFDETIPCAPSEGFPYPIQGPDAPARARDSIER